MRKHFKAIGFYDGEEIGFYGTEITILTGTETPSPPHEALRKSFTSGRANILKPGQYTVIHLDKGALIITRTK